MVKGWGAGCCLLCPLSIYWHLDECVRWRRERSRRGKDGKEESGVDVLGVFAVLLQAASTCTHYQLRSQPAYFKALVPLFVSFLHCCLLAPIFCLIVIHVLSVCLANLVIFRPTRQPRLSMCHGVFFAIFCNICLTLVTHSSPAEFLQDVFLEV